MRTFPFLLLLRTLMNNACIRIPRSSARAMVALAALVMLAGCGSADGLPERPSLASPGRNTDRVTPSVAPSNTPASPSDSPAAVDSVSETIVCSPDGPPLTPFTGPAVAEFGAGAVMDAYCESAAFFVQHAVTNLTDPIAADPRNAARDLRFVVDRLTVGAAQRWNRTAAAAAGSSEAQQSLSDLTFYRLTLPRGYRYPADGPMTVGGEVSMATADVATLPDGRSALALWYSVRIGLPVSTGGGRARATHLLPLTRKMALYLVPNADPHATPDQSWLVDSWTTHWRAGAAEPWRSGR